MSEGVRAQLRERQLPPGRPVMFQTWRDLLFLHWRIPAGSVNARLPRGLELDTYNGSAWIGIVPFFMRHVRPAGVPPLPLLSNFLELNLRTYVRDRQGRPGVWFFSLDANQPVAVLVARLAFGLNYRLRTMSASRWPNSWISYECRSVPRSVSQRYRYRATGRSQPATPGSLEFFLLERYRLFAERKQRILSGRVYHVPYEFTSAEIEPVDARVFDSNGLVNPLRQPDHVCYSPRADVWIYPLET
jgi:uncharacterized protein YqjF (DUF2071 family)